MARVLLRDLHKGPRKTVRDVAMNTRLIAIWTTEIIFLFPPKIKYFATILRTTQNDQILE